MDCGAGTVLGSSAMPHSSNTRRATLLLTAAALLVLACVGVSAMERSAGSALWGADAASPAPASAPSAQATPSRTSGVALLAACGAVAWLATRRAERVLRASRRSSAQLPVRFPAPLRI